MKKRLLFVLMVLVSERIIIFSTLLLILLDLEYLNLNILGEINVFSEKSSVVPV